MDAVSSQQLRRRGASRLLGDCAALERLAPSDRPSARARLESELGHELAALLLDALAAVAERRPGWALR